MRALQVARALGRSCAWLRGAPLQGEVDWAGLRERLMEAAEELGLPQGAVRIGHGCTCGGGGAGAAMHVDLCGAANSLWQQLHLCPTWHLPGASVITHLTHFTFANAMDVPPPALPVAP